MFNVIKFEIYPQQTAQRIIQIKMVPLQKLILKNRHYGRDTKYAASNT
jgi:hypothetical protein